MKQKNKPELESPTEKQQSRAQDLSTTEGSSPVFDESQLPNIEPKSVKMKSNSKVE